MMKIYIYLLSIIGLFLSQPYRSLAEIRPKEIREYIVNTASAAPIIDGTFTEEEWANSEWTGDFIGLDTYLNQNFRNETIPLNYRWRALWDEHYLYLLVTSEILYLPVNGYFPDGRPAEIKGDDDATSFGFFRGQTVDIEWVLEPNWQSGDGYNSNPPELSEAGGSVSDGYRLAWIIVDADRNPDGTVFTPGNSGIRNSQNPTGPPWFWTAAQYNNSAINSTAWKPSFLIQSATSQALPFLAGASLHRVTDPVLDEPEAYPVLEIAIPFSQLNPDFGVPAQGKEGETNLTLVQDENEQYVKSGDEWLINVGGYADPWIFDEGLAQLIWNNTAGSNFASYPRGVLRFANPTRLDDWTLF